jgi:hypothetical protein
MEVPLSPFQWRPHRIVYILKILHISCKSICIYMHDLFQHFLNLTIVCTFWDLRSAVPMHVSKGYETDFFFHNRAAQAFASIDTHEIDYRPIYVTGKRAYTEEDSI